VNPGTCVKSVEEIMASYEKEAEPRTDCTVTRRFADGVRINPSIKAGSNRNTETQKHLNQYDQCSFLREY